MALQLFLIVPYVTIATVAVFLCCVSLLGIVKTKRTVYVIKLFSAGLLVVDIFFLIISSISKFFPYQHVFLLQHVARGLHVTSWIAVVVMSLERLYAINWPYLYIRMATKRRCRAVCVGTYTIGFLQYAIIRGLACYTSQKGAVECTGAFRVYLLLLLVLMPAISFVSYCQLYRIFKQSFQHMSHHRKRISEFRGTWVSFVYMINTFICSLVYLVSGVHIVVSGINTYHHGRLGMITDFISLVRCFVDPLVYIIWYRETRLQLLKVAQSCFPGIEPKVKKMQVEIFNIQTYSPKFTTNATIERSELHPE